MPENWMFLAFALVMSTVGSVVLWWRARKPRPWDSGIEEFRREMQALAARSQVLAHGHERQVSSGGGRFRRRRSRDSAR